MNEDLFRLMQGVHEQADSSAFSGYNLPKGKIRPMLVCEKGSTGIKLPVIPDNCFYRFVFGRSRVSGERIPRRGTVKDGALEGNFSIYRK